MIEKQNMSLGDQTAILHIRDFLRYLDKHGVKLAQFSYETEEWLPLTREMDEVVVSYLKKEGI